MLEGKQSLPPSLHAPMEICRSRYLLKMVFKSYASDRERMLLRLCLGFTQQFINRDLRIAFDDEPLFYRTRFFLGFLGFRFATFQYSIIYEIPCCG
jgi:hypothetical protein